MFYVLFMCKCVLPLGGNPIAVDKYININNQYAVHCYNHRWNRVVNKTLEHQSPNHDTSDHFSSHCGFFVHGRQLFSTSVACNLSMHEEMTFYNYLFYRFDGLVSFYLYCVIFVIVTLVWRILLLLIYFISWDKPQSGLWEPRNSYYNVAYRYRNQIHRMCISSVCSCFNRRYIHSMPIPVAARSKRRGSAPARLPLGTWKSVVFAMCRKVVISAMDRSLIQRKPTECGVSDCDLEISTGRWPRPNGTVEPLKYTVQHNKRR
jgi:hypothetical protein